MLIFKRFIVWAILLGLTSIQFLLYLPSFTCTFSPLSSFCSPQFNFGIVGTSIAAKEFIGSVREFLKLLSYLTLDMGWSNELIDPEIYKDENLIDTFQDSNVYKVNYLGFCKKNDIEDKKIYCVSNGLAGMDILGILIRDIGLQLGELSSAHVNDTRQLGDSMVFTYHLTLNSLRKLFKNDKKKDKGFSKILLGDQKNADGPKNYRRGIDIAYTLMLFNKVLTITYLTEFSISFICVAIVVAFGMVLLWGKHHRFIPLFLKIFGSLLMLLSTITFCCNIIYLLILKAWEVNTSETTSVTGWEMLKVSIGSGFMINGVRYVLQWVFLPVLFLTANHYGVKATNDDKTKENDNGNRSGSSSYLMTDVEEQMKEVNNPFVSAKMI
ncbi:Sma2p NDAI_0D03070 [Naumovozyma dairenensis CBS 421]|uniref:Spore membrane assembly protein 2 n=1 Tax=Naumovozyma dairenensis (strain ATCC 10597 / BCRC 20456 / CBS 421 / NBRC 0211 / NRRL Y-12639) TaxID=1071378 RepID=G0WA10_NAUDC|nr:hypothetical protein NDAI_0D03070 [Naumovozyma dairenensis CBS 421]CCD24621.1 hypothetical protein NDAI_0D03070 [Naumovozyma dairenensis CBS 421]